MDQVRFGRAWLAITSIFLMGLVIGGGELRAEEANGEARAWRETLDRVAKSVVVLRVASPRSFDDVSPGTGTATGFVIDAAQGLILTNRHVVTPGPVVAEAVFQNNEEVAVQAVYRDPVHDFGIFRFDPEAVRFMDTGELALSPEHAQVGTQIRVVGNDAGEKISILQGTIARLDREAPHYGRKGFNDFNTFYIQAASGTSGGSSGSPVVDIDGRVVALNAGGKRLAASSFYLPLDRVKRAVELIRAGTPVTRGTVQTVLRHSPFDEVRRLGLRPETEELIRSTFPDGTGMIVVREVVPGGPADGVLEVGDVVVRVSGQPVNSFLPIESVLDDGVGGSVVFDVERGGKPTRVEVEIQDLHSISPDQYFEFGGGVLNPLSYQLARNASVPAGGVYVASAGYAFSRAGVPSRSVITEIAGEATPTLERFEEVVANKPHDARLAVRYFPLSQPRAKKVAVLRNDRRWFPARHCRRDDSTGRWPCEPLAPPPTELEREVGQTDFHVEGDWALRRLAPSIVMVRSSLPYLLDGVHGNQFYGSGLIVDPERGLVVVDRETMPNALGDLTLTFSGSLEVPGELVYLHPEHNLAVVRYDPVLIGDTPVRAAKFRDVELEVGDTVWLVALSPTERLASRKTRISRIEPIASVITQPPRFREKNLEIVSVDDRFQSVGGVLTDRFGRVLSLWASFTSAGSGTKGSYFGGIASHHVLRMIEPLLNDEAVDWHSLGLELSPLTLAAARDRGLSDKRARRLERHDPEGRRLLAVQRRAVGMPGAEHFREGDLILSLDGEPVTRHRDLRPISKGGRFQVEVLRDGDELALEVEPAPMSGEGTTRALRWSGALLQAPHPALAWQYNIEPGGVYVSRHWFGSPSTRYRLDATMRITRVDGNRVADLDEFRARVAEKKDGDAVRLDTLDLDGKPGVLTLKVDLDYWPTFELKMEEGTWRRIE